MEDLLTTPKLQKLTSNDPEPATTIPIVDLDPNNTPHRVPIEEEKVHLILSRFIPHISTNTTHVILYNMQDECNINFKSKRKEVQWTTTSPPITNLLKSITIKNLTSQAKHQYPTWAWTTCVNYGTLLTNKTIITHPPPAKKFHEDYTIHWSWYYDVITLHPWDNHIFFNNTSKKIKYHNLVQR